MTPLAVRELMGVGVEPDVALALDHADRGSVPEAGHIVLADNAVALMADARFRIAYLGVGAGV